jgi:very-short-patch-repair endonuclease
MADYIPLAKRKSFSSDVRRAKKLRQESPLAERLLWEALRASAKAWGLRFRRQHPIHPYIVDFICLKAHLVIEIDGPSHDIRLAQDEQRDACLKKLGYKVMRFSNEDVRGNLENVVAAILNRARELIEGLYIPLP